MAGQENAVARDVRNTLEALGWKVLRLQSGMVTVVAGSAVTQARASGNRMYRMQLCPPGTPDLLAIPPVGYHDPRPWWIETKVAKAAPKQRRPKNWPANVPWHPDPVKPEQERVDYQDTQEPFHADLRERGQRVITVTSIGVLLKAMGLDSPWGTYDTQTGQFIG